MKHLKLYDSYDQPNLSPIDKKELKNLSRLDFENKWSSGKYFTPGDHVLSDVMQSSKEDSKFNVNDEVVNMIHNTIPITKSFKLDLITSHRPEYETLRFVKSLPLGFIDYQNFRAEIDFCITHYLIDDEIMERNKNTFQILLSTRIRPDRISISGDANDIKVLDLIRVQFPNLKGLEITQKALYDAPNDADAEFAKRNYYVRKQIKSVTGLQKHMPIVKRNMEKFNSYLQATYDVDIFAN